MKTRVLAMLVSVALVTGLSTAITPIANAQLEETITFNYGKGSQTGKSVEIVVYTPDRQKFLADPVGTLRRQGFAVERAAEAHWRAFTVALRRLDNSAVANRRSGSEVLHYTIVLRRVKLTFVGDWNGDGSIARGARRFDPNGFLNDPVGTLRAQGIEVPAAHEAAWRQLGGALRELRRGRADSADEITSATPAARDRGRLGEGSTTAPGRISLPESENEQTRPPRRRPTGRPTGPTQSLSAGEQPTLDRQAFEGSLHAAVSPNVMGYTFLLIKDGRVTAEGAGGWARNAADGQMAMTTKTPQNLGSLFKFITGVTMLHLLDRPPAGSAGGDNTLQARLGAPTVLLYPQPWSSGIKYPTVRTITFRHLLQHRSGFRACSTPLGCFGKRYNTTLLGQREYENINFSLMGYLIPLYTTPSLVPALNTVAQNVPADEWEDHAQLVLGDRMDRFLRDTMFPMAPGNISASCDAEDEYKATGAYGYVSKSDKGKGIITSRRNANKPCSGAGGYWMSIRDFGAFVAAALHSNRILSQEARLEMYRTGMPADDRLVWSFTTSDPWISDKFKMPTIIWSNGIQPYDGGQSFNTVLLRLPLNYELMVFANSGGMTVNGLAGAGLNAFRAGMGHNFQ